MNLVPRPLDRIRSIKLKLAILMVASGGVAFAFFNWQIGWLPPRTTLTAIDRRSTMRAWPMYPSSRLLSIGQSKRVAPFELPITRLAPSRMLNQTLQTKILNLTGKLITQALAIRPFPEIARCCGAELPTHRQTPLTR